ncbi:MAG: DUF3037 domain-containing protein [Acidobacteria bacterium]|nr:MAG: DUF3037 domain-containing protein [Acidobacteriota bacterium]
MDTTQCDFLLMRYVPDPFRNEFVNIGVLLLGREDQFADVRFTHDWARVRCADPQADVDILEALESDIRQQLQSSAESRKQIVYRLQDTLSNGLQLSEPSALLSESPTQDLERLAQTYLERPKLRRESRLGARQRIVGEMRNAFEVAGVWDSLNKKIKAAKYTHRGDPLRIDCGYRPNGVIRLFHAVSLAAEPDSAKVLAFSYPALSEGIAQVEDAKTDLTAIIEDGLNREDDAIQFAIHTLERTSINVAPISQLGLLAERARKELRLAGIS